MRRLIGGIFLLLLAGPAIAQQPVQTWSGPTTTAGKNASGTIASTGVWQVVFAVSSSRKGCTIINNGTHTMYVTEGLGTAASTTSNSVQLAAGQAYYCTVGNIVLTGEIDITGTAGDAFYAAQE